MLECLSKWHTVISIEQIDYTGKHTHNGVNYHFKKFSQAERLAPRRLHRYIRDLRPDFVFVHGLHYPLQVLQLKFQLRPKTKIIVQNHAEKPSRGFKKILQQLVERYVDAYLFTSYEMGLDWIHQGNLSNTKKIREVMEASSVFYPVDREMARLKLHVQGNPVFLWVGRLDENKDPLTVVSAFLEFSRLHSAARLYMIFQTTALLPALSSLKIREDVNDVINLVGQVPNPEMLFWYNSADFIISGSHYEGSGIAVCEAMSCGCVPIVTNIPSFRKMTSHCGFLYEPGNRKALAETLQQVMRLDWREARARVIRQFNAELSFEAMARQIHEIAGSL